MKVLVVAPHPDDEAIGCGGTILRHTHAGDRVEVVFLTSGELSMKERPAVEVQELREQEARMASRVLGVEQCFFLRLPDWGLAGDMDRTAAALEPVVVQARPERIYVTHENEWHPDHRAAAAVAARIFGDCGHSVLPIFTYEVWTPLQEFEMVEDISEQISGKIDAIRCYRSQLASFDYITAARGLAEFRGALAARTAYAEVFGHLSVES